MTYELTYTIKFGALKGQEVTIYTHDWEQVKYAVENLNGRYKILK